MESMNAKSKGFLNGLIAAPFTPLDAKGEVNLDAIDRLADALVADGVKGAFVCGTTGESLSFTVAERKAVAERWVGAAAGRLKIVVHAGHQCLKDAAELVRHAAAIGADAVSAMPPSFFRPETLDDLIDWCAALAAEAPQMPFYYYHIPERTGVSFRMIDFLERAAERIPNLRGIKYTHTDLMDLAACAAFQDGQFDMLIGKDEMLLYALMAGARGAIGSTYSFAAPIYNRVISALLAGNIQEAQQAQLEAIAVIRAFSKFGGIASQKAIMKMRGFDCGPVRPPLKDLSPEAYQKLQAEMAALGIV